MKKIIFLIHDITQHGGTERITLALTQQMTSDGIPCEIFSLKKNNEKIFYPFDNIEISFAKAKNKYMAMLEAVSFARKKSARLVVVSMGRLSVEFSFIARTVFFRNFYLYEHVAFESFSNIIQKIKLLSFRFSQGVIFLTENDRLLVQAILPKVKLIAIKNINPYIVNEITPFNQRENIVLAVGRLTYQKNFPRLLSIWGKINSSGWKLIIIGSGEQKEILENIIRESTMDNVLLLDATKNIELIYKKSKVFTMSSRYEGLPMVLIESQGFGVPSISFDCKTGPKEIIIQDETGYIIPYDDDNEFVDKLQLLMNNSNILERLSHNAFIQSSRFSYDKIKDLWLTFLNEDEY
ncbi:hypothetical protein TUM12370_12930 [Salmonella enterica subsp. enterica serovar Choleraesuis]|nr:hypothetical protein TUM12370_12930 [Salmonella enterica subsp. enterica serovar Choleraesuis]